MLRPRVHTKALRRGAAIVELALVVPLLVSLLMFSVFLSDVIRARLKLQEASRYAAWEMSSYTLSDYATADHGKAFEVARQASVKEAAERYKDLDSLEPEGRFGTLLRAEPAQVSIRNQAVAGLDLSRVFPGGAGGTRPEEAAAVGKPLDFFLERFRFNTQGQVEVEVTSTLASHMLPRRYLQKEQHGFFDVDNWGGRDLSHLPVKSRYTLIANGWHLPDGGDALMKSKRAGVHDGGSPHGLSLQVGRMKFLGVGSYLDQVGLGRLDAVARFIFPDFAGTFVVSHNYVPGESARGCNKTRHGAPMGLNNLNTYPGLDDPAQRCFDTAPFRDTQEYDHSLYRKMFRARGGNFMGCKHAQADMPNLPDLDPRASLDKNAQRIPCE
ncbi:TadE/TadG family type IV pilus assembly protein [Vitiosangium sp. GDMCC 1.1324]|uniref:TadE/TadG family type IV pilus assembly protein n=1 Tax=Vitiosangium sp. (strain GDMCC 1.1324) TaxID=2138576 RepID=UPI000D3549B2|nr:TadE/TadG family type IV pilus assembly protein [Vitiosangium sp. GDMCC 1.1324]PTL76134.1 pilus assembly protein [Vitiosangium sp. GDMCC 1.1324]